MNGEYILQIDSLTKSFVRNIVNIRGESDNERFYIIKNLDLSVEKGIITALIGGNGAGKTTLFNIISGFMEPDAGSIIFRNNGSDTDLLKLPPHKISRHGIGRMFQDNHIFPEMTVLNNMLIADEKPYGEAPFVSMIFPKKNRQFEKVRTEEARVIFEELFGTDNPFWAKKEDKAKSLSYGQQRLLGLARLMMGNYTLLLLDEPTSGVSPVYTEQIISILKYLAVKKKITIFLIEHNFEFIKKIADKCVMISSYNKYGSIATPPDSPDAFFHNPDLMKKYMGI